MQSKNQFAKMEKRRSKRINNNFEANFISGRKKCAGVIENFSKSGLLVIAASIKSVTTFIPETTVTLKFQCSKRVEINLQCEIRWVHINKIPLYGFRYRMGVEIIDPPARYKEFLEVCK